MEDKSKYCTIYLVRHGETDWNKKDIIQGQIDTPLNKKGESQALKMASKLEKIHFDAIFSSDLARAKHTAEHIAAKRKLAVKTTKALRERYFGKFQGKKFPKEKNIRKMIEDLVKKSKIESEKPETDDLIISRLTGFLREVSTAYPGKTILLATHAAPIRTLLIHLGFGNYDNLPNGCISNLAYVKIKSDGKNFIISSTSGIQKER